MTIPVASSGTHNISTHLSRTLYSPPLSIGDPFIRSWLPQTPSTDSVPLDITDLARNCTLTDAGPPQKIAAAKSHGVTLRVDPEFEILLVWRRSSRVPPEL